MTDNDSPHFRIIPSIERWPLLVRFAKTLGGQVCILAAYILLFASCGRIAPSWEFYLFLSFLALAPIPKNQRFIVGALVFAVFLLPDLWFGQATNGQEILFLDTVGKAIGAKLHPHLYLYRSAILAGCLVLFFILGRLATFRRASSPILGPIGIWLLLLVAALRLPNQDLTGILAWLFVAKAGACLGWAAYLQLAGRGGSRQPTDLSAALFPLLGSALAGPPIITNPAAIDFPQAVSSAEKLNTAVCRIKGLKLLLWTRILLFVRACTIYFFFGQETPGAPSLSGFASLHWPNYLFMGVANYTAQHVSPAQTWIVIFVNLFVDFFLRFALYYGVIIAVIRLSGFYVPRSIVRPYLAKTFNEYYRRSLYFYSEAIVHFFFLPSWRWLYVLRRHKSLRLFFSLFFSLSIGGWFLHLSWATNYFLVYDRRLVLSYFFSWIPYYTLISVISWWSAAGPAWRVRWLPEWISQPLVFLGAFTVHALLLALLPKNPEERWYEHLNLLVSLFRHS